MLFQTFQNLKMFMIFVVSYVYATIIGVHASDQELWS